MKRQRKPEFVSRTTEDLQMRGVARYLVLSKIFTVPSYSDYVTGYSGGYPEGNRAKFGGVVLIRNNPFRSLPIKSYNRSEEEKINAVSFPDIKTKEQVENCPELTHVHYTYAIVDQFQYGI